MSRKKTDSSIEYIRRRRKQFRPWLEAMGLHGFLEALPKAMVHFVLSQKYPIPGIEFENAPSWWPEVQKKIEADWSAMTFDPFGDGRQLPVMQGITIYAPLLLMVKTLIAESTKIARRFKAPPDLWEEMLDKSVALLGEPLAKRLREVASVDRVLLRTQAPRWDNWKRARMRCVWTLSMLPPQMEHIEIEGKSRPIYRLGAPLAVPGTPWAEFDVTVLGLPARTGKLPVYVQSHALHRMRERLIFWPEKLAHVFEQVPACAESWLMMAVAAPKVVRRKGTEFLLEYRLANKKLGYIVADLVQRKVVIRTFLLCGMQGTPEAKLLRDKLKMGRKEVEWLQMDTLREWSLSDLRFDPVIRQIAHECGLSDLLHFADIGKKYYFTESAEALRRFLGEDLIRKAAERANEYKEELPSFLSQPERLVA